MSAATDFEVDDYTYVADFLDGWIPSPLPSDNWRGIVAENRSLDPAPAPTGDRGAPTLFLVWALEYDELHGCMDPTQAPVRRGRWLGAAYSEPSAGRGHVLRLFQEVREHVEAQPEGRLIFFTDEARTRRVGLQGDWYVDALEIPFAGG